MTGETIMNPPTSYGMKLEPFCGLIKNEFGFIKIFNLICRFLNRENFYTLQ